MKHLPSSIAISTWSMIKGTLSIIGLLLGLWILYTTQHIVVLFLMSLLIAMSLNPVVDHWERYHIPRSVSVLLCYVIGLLAATLAVSLLVPMVVGQVGTFSLKATASLQEILLYGVQDLPIPLLSDELKSQILGHINAFIENIDLAQVAFTIQEYSSLITTQLSSFTGNVWVLFKAIFSGILDAILVLLISFFLIVDKKAIGDFCKSLLPARHRDYIVHKTALLQKTIGAWARGQVILCVAVGTSVYISLWILSFFGLDIPYKETLAIIAALMEFIPILGPTLSMIPAFLVALNSSFVVAIWVLIVYLLIQQLENSVLVPIIMNKAVGLSPVITIIVLLIGAQFYGLLGIILAIPVASGIAIFVKEYARREQ